MKQEYKSLSELMSDFKATIEVKLITLHNFRFLELLSPMPLLVFHITELVLNYLPDHVLSCVLTKHTMWTSEFGIALPGHVIYLYISEFVSNWLVIAITATMVTLSRHLLPQRSPISKDLLHGYKSQHINLPVCVAALKLRRTTAWQSQRPPYLGSSKRPSSSLSACRRKRRHGSTAEMQTYHSLQNHYTYETTIKF